MKDHRDRRLFVRIPVNFQLKFSLEGALGQSLGSVDNVSLRGIGVLTDSLLPCGASLECWLYLSEKHQPFYSKGEVMWARQEGENTFRVGLNLFTPVTTGVAHLLRENN